MNVFSTGELDLSVQFPEWSSVSHFLLLIVVFIKRIFYLPNLWTQAVKPYNTEALRLYVLVSMLFVVL